MNKKTLREITIAVHMVLTFALIPLAWADQMKWKSEEDDSIPLTALVVDWLYSCAAIFSLYKLFEPFFR